MKKSQREVRTATVCRMKGEKWMLKKVKVKVKRAEGKDKRG